LLLMAFVTNPRRDASPTITGFVFQVNVTILRWLELQQGEHLELECGEDIDTVQNCANSNITPETRLLEQVKTRTRSSLTLKSAEALQALSNFCSHRAANPTSKLTFRYITTASNGVEQGWNRPESAIETWMALRRGRYDESARPEAIAALRTLLRSYPRPQKVSPHIWQAFQDVLTSDDDTHLSDVILGFEWGLGHGDYSQSEAQIIATLTGSVHRMRPEDASQAYEHLFGFVFTLLCQPGRKHLTVEALATELQTPTVTEADRVVLQLVRNELEQMTVRIASVETAVAHQAKDVTALKQSVGLIGKTLGFESAFALSAVSLSTDSPDLVNPCATRQKLVDVLLSRAQADGIVALVAEPGSGKTQLLILLTAKAKRPPHWLNIPRHATEAQACVLLDSLVRLVGGQLANLPFRESYDAAAEQFRGGLLVIDDLPRVIPGGPLATRIERLARRLRDVGAYLLISSYFPLPATTEQPLGKVHCDVPRFTVSDVAELLAAAHAPQELRTNGSCQLLVTVSEGLPTLVMAAIRYLANANWNFTTAEIEALCGGEFASAHRLDASTLLQITIPDSEERELLVRMSLAVGPFTMEDIASVARVPRAIPLPGEKVQRSMGVWLQQIGTGSYLRSPLITSALADSLDPKTRKGVHYVLALRILSRKILEPIEAFACVNHLLMAQHVPFAVMVVIQTLAAYIELDDPIEDDFGFSRMWPSSHSLADVDVNLHINLRAAQATVLAKQGRDVAPTLNMLDALIADVGGTGWGLAIAASGLAIHLVWRHPVLANKYLLLALHTFADARLPDGSTLPRLGSYPLEHILWISAYNCKSDADVDSWLATLSRYTPEQIKTLKNSEMMEDNITILCDGTWMRDYQKPESERDWIPVRKKLEEIEVTARVVDFPLLEAAAVRTRIMILAEWENDLDAALALSQSTLDRFDYDDCRFLILEVTGRQLSYSGRRQEATAWLKRALTCDAYRLSMWRRNVLITLAELHASDDPERAEQFTADAVRLSRDAKFVEPLLIETLAEHGIALWNAGERHKSFEVFEQATDRIFAIQSNADRWKGQFARLFAVIAYFSGVAHNGRPQDGHVEPKQGLFLSSNDQACIGYRPEQTAYICIRLAMFADGVMDVLKAAAWTWKAIELAKQNPAEWNVVRLAAWHAMPAALLSDDFVRAAQLANVMIATDVNEIIATAKASTEIGATDTISRVEAFVDRAPHAPKSGLRVIPTIPIAIRLASLQFRGTPTTATAASLAVIESMMPKDLQPENFVDETRRALIDEIDWRVLWNDGCRATREHEYIRGCVLSIGAMDKAPVPQSLYLQISIAENLEGFFRPCPSIYREIVAPFFVAYWERTVSQYIGLFRTALAYTQRQIKAADGSAKGTRQLLSAMRFCLGVTLPDPQMKWLDVSD
jgi:tetratricopeptide (TPR) repeat protein